MTKHAATALADILRYELQQWGITVHDIQPGFFRQVLCLQRIRRAPRMFPCGGGF
jgi:NAD(P)-dependent dehydrogenase (short-subunit alcohol dehydrogenase family)